MQVISGGVDAFNALHYGQHSVENQRFFQSQIESIPALAAVGEMGSKFMSYAKAAYERWNGSEAMQLIRNATRHVASLFQPEEVRSIFDMFDFQTASLTMQRWIMANPTVRKAAMDQRCDGYADTYVNVDPGKIGESHYDWRRVNDSVVQVTDMEDKESTWEVKYYLENLRKGDKELSPINKVDILNTWRIAELFFENNKEDPTSPYGTRL